MSYVDRIWDKDLFSSDASSRPERTCPDSVPFESWCRQVCSLVQTPSLASIRQKKLLLQEKYWDFYRRVDRACREHTSDRYRCIFHVYREWYEKLDMAELALHPPEDYFLERRPQPPPQIVVRASREERHPALYVGACEEEAEGEEPAIIEEE